MNRRRLVFLLIAVAAAFALAVSANAQDPQATNGQAGAAPVVVEHGKFILHKMEQPLGEETFETTREAGPGGETLTTQIKFKFTDRGAAVPLSVTLRTSGD